MDVHESLERFGLVPDDEALPHVRALLAWEAECERRSEPRTEDLALLCCVQLFGRGFPEDSLRIWAAKMSGFDLGCYLEIELLCGAGLSATMAFLAGHPSPEAASALGALQECQARGDFDGFKPEEVLEEYRRYFGAK